VRKIVAFLFLLTTVSFAGADTHLFKFGGEDFTQKFEVKSRAPNAQIEFGLPNEKLPAWTKLVTLHFFATSGNDAKRAAATLANLIRERHKGTKYAVITNQRTSEAIIDFLLPVPNTELMEFNVFKYSPAGNELVALQFAQRVKLGEIDAEELSVIRQRALKEMGNYDMAPVKAFFGKASS